ncbi:hypothetical protein scyTo_0023701, partial [Scyliorhinus torazame]|nr:hypothetical protein [Scyliorhinus torazame]
MPQAAQQLPLVKTKAPLSLTPPALSNSPHPQPLSELEYVNLSYNLLEKVPVFSSCSRVQLTTLLLRNNELENINGVEHLSHLKHLDLAYNMISEHSQLAPLSQLHSLKELFLEGNPVCYQKAHRPSTIHHLSPKAAFMR